MQSTSELEDEITLDLEDEIGMPRTKLESPRTKLGITSDLGKKSLRTWEEIT